MDKFILIEKFQAEFVVKESERINLEQIDTKCRPPNTNECQNDVFVAFPKLKYFIQSETNGFCRIFRTALIFQQQIRILTVV